MQKGQGLTRKYLASLKTPKLSFSGMALTNKRGFLKLTPDLWKTANHALFVNIWEV
jgi:hypothetical protein